MKPRWRKTALWAALTVSAVGAVVLAAEIDGPDVDPVYFELSGQDDTGNPVACMGNSGGTLGLGYPIAVKMDGNGAGNWDIYLPQSGSGNGLHVAHGAAAPPGAYAFAGTVNITPKAGDNNGLNFASSFAINAMILKPGSGGEVPSSSVYPYVVPPNEAALIALGWPNGKTYPGAQVEDDGLDAPPNVTQQGLSHIEICLDPQPTVTKTADLSWQRWRDWSISKTVNGQESVTLELDVGANANVDYDVVATPTAYRSEFRVEGEIEISDPIERGFTLSSVTDTLTVEDAGAFVATEIGGVVDKGDFESFDCVPVNDATTVIFRCAYAIELPSASHPNLAAGDDVVNQVDVVLSFQGVDTELSFNTPAQVFAATPDASFGDQLVVDDDMLAGNPNHTFPQDGPWTYMLNFACPQPGQSQRLNTVTGTYTTGGAPGMVTDSAVVNLACIPLPTVEKTADGDWERSFTWQLDKSVTPDDIDMYQGDSHEVRYTVTATRSAADNAYTVSGNITVFDETERVFDLPQTGNGTLSDVVTIDGQAFNAPASCVADGTPGNDIVFNCTYTLSIDGDDWPAVNFGGGGSNTVTVNLRQGGVQKYQVTDTQAFGFGTPTEFGATLTVTDPVAPDSPRVFDGSPNPDSWVYFDTFTCNGDEGTHLNTATGVYSTEADPTVEISDSASVTVDCHAVTVSKTANTRFDRDYAWTPDKKIVVTTADISDEDAPSCTPLPPGAPYLDASVCEDVTIELAPNAIYETVYQLNAVKSVPTGGDTNHEVFGTITVAWDGPMPVFDPMPPVPDDVLTINGQPVVATVGACVIGSSAMTCPYVADVPDKTAGTNAASIDRPFVCLEWDGDPIACAVPGMNTFASGPVPFSFANATIASETDECVSLSDLFNDGGLNFGPSFDWDVLGGNEACSSTTVYVSGEVDGAGSGKILDIRANWWFAGADPTAGELDGFVNADCEFLVPNLLSALSNDSQTLTTDEAVITVRVPDVCDQGCTLTQGYWKTHANVPGKPQFGKKRDITWDMVMPNAEATTFFLSGQSWIQVFWTPPKGNAYYNLAHQYMAAKLNTYAGASVPPAVATAIANAEGWFNSYPPTGANSGFWKTSKTQVMQAAGTLGSYNEGDLGPGHCDEAPQRLMILSK